MLKDLGSEAWIVDTFRIRSMACWKVKGYEHGLLKNVELGAWIVGKYRVRSMVC